MVWIGGQGAAVANALPMFALALMILVLMSRQEKSSEIAAAPALDLHAYFRGMVDMIKQRAVLMLCLMAGFRTMTQNGILIFLPMYLADAMGFKGICWAL